MISKRSDVNKINNDGWTALMIASQNGHSDAIGLLISKGSDVNLMTKDGKTASIIAMLNGYFDALKLLVDPKTIDSKKSISHLRRW